MNWVDIAILGIVVSSVLLGLFWGLIRQVVSVLGLAAGIFFAGRLYQPIADFLHPEEGGGLVADPNWARIIAFGGVVIGFSLLIGIAGSILRFAANLLFLGGLDHLLGGLMGLVTSVSLVMAMLVVATVFPVPNLSQAIRDSVVAHWLGVFVPVIVAMLPPEFGTFRQMAGWGSI
ncbi:MAG: CvpA family protein [Chloroflexia bacterium]